MNEIFTACDSVTVLRDGRHIETWQSLDGISSESLIERMVGRELEDVYHHTPRDIGAEALEIDQLLGPGLSEPVSFDVAVGEIVGIFGLVGAGRSELLKLLYGAAAPAEGTVRLAGRPVRFRHPRDAIRAGVVLCPEDRKDEGLFPHLSVLENINLSARRRQSRWRMVLRGSWEKENADRQIQSLGIRTPSPRQMMRNLSGGNQQKAILGRWLSESVRVLLLDEPTRGIDVGAKAEIYRVMMDLSGQGMAIVMVSSELSEVLGVSDRILVMREGVLAGDLPRDEATPEKVLGLALPVGPNSNSDPLNARQPMSSG
jgi:L-arabinose transport system ATP-binding protein